MSTKTDKPAKKGAVVYPPAFLVSIYTGPSKILIPFLLFIMVMIFGWPFGTFAYESNSGFWAPDREAAIPDKPRDDRGRYIRHMVYMIVSIVLLVLYFLGLAVVKTIYTMPTLSEQQSESK